MFVEITRGRSFKGLAQYCLHDVGAPTADRVAFVETRNLATDNPQLAWRIMTARYYLQDELKAQAGVGRGGSKDGKPVGHLLLSWKREEADAEQLSRRGMLEAADGALQAIGASRHQALIICHTDTPHPHCHIIINLIGDDGRLKKNWNEKRKLSKFAFKRELEVHGEAIMKQREKNWQARDAGESPTPVKKKPRSLYELDKAAQKSPEIKAFAVRHRKALQELEQSKAAQLQRHKDQQAKFKWCLNERRQRTQTVVEFKIRASRTTVREAYQQRWLDLRNQQDAQRRAFDRNEQSLSGSLANAMQLIDWKRLLRPRGNSKRPGWKDVLPLLTSEAARRDRFRRQQLVERDRLRTRERQKEQAQERALREGQTSLLTQQRQAYLRKAAALHHRQSRSQRALQERQQALTKERNEILKEFREQERLLKQQNLERNRKRQPLAIDVPLQRTVSFLQPDAQEVADLVPSESSRTRLRRPRKERPPHPARKRSASQVLDHKSQDLPPPDVVKHTDDFEERMLRTLRERDHQQDREDRER